MNKNNPLTVVHSNELIEGSYALDINEMRVVLMACTKIDSRKKNPGAIKLYPGEFAELFGVERRRAYGMMSEALSGLFKKPIITWHRGKKVQRVWLVEVIEDIDPTDLSFISIEFSQKITSCLFELKEHFTVVELEQVTKLKGFAFRLYQWLIEARNLNNNRQDDGQIWVELEIDEMKERHGVLNKYPRWGDFKDYVLNPAVEQINKLTDISVIYTPIKQGRGFGAVQFRYVDDNEASFAAPERPRLRRRPKVLQGSSEEGYWMRDNLKLLLDYEKASLQYKKTFKLALNDLKRVVDYAEKTGHPAAKRYKKQLDARKRDKKKAA